MSHASVRLAFDCVQHDDADVDEQQQQQALHCHGRGGAHVPSCFYVDYTTTTTTTAASSSTMMTRHTRRGRGTALVLRYYAADHTLELLERAPRDGARGRVRLQRTASPVPASALVCGTTLVLFGRATTLLAYADAVTRQLRADADERATLLFAESTFALLGRLLAMLTEECGFVVVHVHLTSVPADATSCDDDDNNRMRSSSISAVTTGYRTAAASHASLPAALAGTRVVGVVAVRAHATAAAASFVARCHDELRRAHVDAATQDANTDGGYSRGASATRSSDAQARADVYASRDTTQAAAWERALCTRDRTAPEGVFGAAAAADDSTVVVLKPHVLHNGNGGAVLQHLLDAVSPSLRLAALTSRTLTAHAARALLQPYYGASSSSGRCAGVSDTKSNACAVLPDYVDAVHSLTGTVWAVQLARTPASPYATTAATTATTTARMGVERARDKSSVVDAVRAVCGPHDVVVARALQPRSVRARFGVDATHNAVHCCDVRDDAPLYADFFLRCV